MYKVFFVDDEAAIRAGIRNNIDWDNTGFVLAGEAPDGEMALSLMQDILPDILITDVKMPFMDGLELAKRAKKSMPWIKIIILSGHDEFEFAKQAITIGVEDYLLKPVTSSKLIEILNKTAAKIEAERESLRNVEKLIESAKKIRIDKLISDMLYSGIEIERAVTLAEELNIQILADYYLVMRIELHFSSNEDYNQSYSVGDCIQRVLESWENAIYSFSGENRVLCVIKGASPAALEEDAYVCAQAVKYEVERDYPCSVSIAVGAIVSDIKEWPKSLAGADTAPGSQYSNVIVKAQEYIQKNYFEQGISLHSVAREVNVSPNHLSTMFRQETGETFINYITRIRIDQAKALLKTTKMRTSDISYEVGYNDTHYFSYVFKKNVGLTPKEFRSSQAL